MFLQVKHFYLDWVFQPKWMWSKKHIYGHYGGILHALINAIGTALIIGLFFGHFVLVLIIDFLCHYHIDWLKMNIKINLNQKPEDHEFWVLIGLDQTLHQFIYLILLAIVTF